MDNKKTQLIAGGAVLAGLAAYLLYSSMKSKSENDPDKDLQEKQAR